MSGPLPPVPTLLSATAEFLRLTTPAVERNIPPPPSVPALSEFAVLFATVVKFRLTVTDPVAAGCSTASPPPFWPAVFPLIVEFKMLITFDAPDVAPEFDAPIPPAFPVAVFAELVLSRTVMFIGPPVATNATPALAFALLPLTVIRSQLPVRVPVPLVNT